MSEWQEVYLNEAFDIGSGLSKPAEDFGSGFPFLSFKEIFNNFFVPEELPELVESSEEERDKCSVKKGDVFLTRTSETVKELGMSCVALKDYENATFNGFTKRLRPNGNLEIVPEYAGYYFRSSKFRNEVTALSSASTRASLNNEMLGRLKIVLPSKIEQGEIAAVLSCLNRKISNLRQQNETLERIAQTLFKHWFVDFEFPNEDGKPYKSSGGEMMRSESGEIPTGWHFLELGNVATNYSETHKFQNKSEIVFINTGDVLEGNFLHHDYSSIKTLPGQAKKKIRQNDILYSEIRPINKRFAYVNFSENLDDYVVSTKFMVVRSSGKILPRLLYLILKGDSTIQEFHHIAESRSGTFPQITFESVSTFPVVIPEIMLQEKLMSVITPLLEKKEFNIQKIETLTKTRDVLLPQLMSGKLRIKD